MSAKRGKIASSGKRRKSFSTIEHEREFVATAASRVVTRHHTTYDRCVNVRSTAGARAKSPKDVFALSLVFSVIER
jgi:hypothetical protein